MDLSLSLPDLIRLVIVGECLALILILMIPPRDQGRADTTIRLGFAALVTAVAYGTVDLLGQPALLRPVLIWAGVTLALAGALGVHRERRRT